MKVTAANVTMLTIENAARLPGRGVLDPIRVITEDYELGKGRMTVTCFDSAWVAYWGAMGGKTVRKFVLQCDSGYLAGCMIRSDARGKAYNRQRYVEDIADAVQQAFRSLEPRVTPVRSIKLERLAHVNALIKVISDHGRRFFYNGTNNRIAMLYMADSGRLYWIDDYNGKHIYTGTVEGYEHKWRGFSHGGTLRDLVQQMVLYVQKGVKIRRYYIAPDHWGYDTDAMLNTRDAAFKLPIIENF